MEGIIRKATFLHIKLTIIKSTDFKVSINIFNWFHNIRQFFYSSEIMNRWITVLKYHFVQNCYLKLILNRKKKVELELLKNIRQLFYKKIYRWQIVNRQLIVQLKWEHFSTKYALIGNKHLIISIIWLI